MVIDKDPFRYEDCVINEPKCPELAKTPTPVSFGVSDCEKVTEETISMQGSVGFDVGNSRKSSRLVQISGFARRGDRFTGREINPICM